MQLKVFTLNCWGIKYVSKDREERIRAIAEELATGKYDIVCLQEVWLTCDYNLIKDKSSGVLPYAHYFYSGVTGSGVCILSKYPIEEVFFHKWAINGYIHKIHHGDWFGGKGVGLCQLRIENFIVNVYSAHLHAEYNRASDEYLVHRILQAFNTAQFIKQTSAHADLVILAGDLNTEPNDLAYRIITSVGGLTDSFGEASPVSDSMVATNEALDNSYTSKSRVSKNIPGIRIDYIMYHTGKNACAKVDKYQLPLPKLVPNTQYSYSDHEAVCVTFNVKRNDMMDEGEAAGNDCGSKVNTIKAAVLEESMDLCTDFLKVLRNHQWVYLIMVFVFLVILAMALVADIPYGYHVLYSIFKSLITIVIFYCFLMGTLWNYIEKHAIMATIAGMDISLATHRKVHKDL